MLRWAVGFLVVALFAALLGFTEIAQGAAWMARALLFLVIVAFIVCATLGVRSRRAVVLRMREVRRLPRR